MASYRNINEPDPAYETRALDAAKTQAELEFWRQRAEKLALDIQTIFDRIDNGELVDLHYRDRSMHMIQAVPSAQEGKR